MLTEASTPGGPTTSVRAGDKLSLSVRRVSPEAWATAGEAVGQPLGSRWHLPPAADVALSGAVGLAFTESQEGVLRSPVICFEGQCFPGAALTLTAAMEVVGATAGDRLINGGEIRVTLPVRLSRRLSLRQCITCTAWRRFPSGAGGFYYDLLRTEGDMLFGLMGEVTCAQPELEDAGIDASTGLARYTGEVTCAALRDPLAAAAAAGDPLEVTAFLVQLPVAEQPKQVEVTETETMLEFWIALAAAGGFGVFFGGCCLLAGMRRSHRDVLADSETGASKYAPESGDSLFT